LACRDNQGHLPLFKDFNVFQLRLSLSSLPQRQSRSSTSFQRFQCISTKTIIVFLAFKTIKSVGLQRQLGSSTSFRRLECLSTKTIIVFRLMETIRVICLYFSKTIIVFCHVETIRVIRLYFSKTIIVFCLAKTIRGIRLYFSRLSKSVVMRRQSWSSSFFTFPRLSKSIVMQRQSRSLPPLLSKDYHSLLSCRDNQDHLLLYFSKTILAFYLAKTIKVIRSFTFRRRQCLQKATMPSFTFQRLS